MTRRAYTATATREGGWWVLEVEGVRGGYTQARRLDQAEAMVRDLIALLLDVPEDSFDVEVVPELSAATWADALQAARQARVVLDETQEQARTALDRAVRAMHEEGLPVRDIGRLLGVSHQYAAKILAAAGRS